MAAGNYLATRAEHEEHRHAKAVERCHIQVVPEGEREEVREIFRRRGLQGELLESVTEAITADRDRWVRTMLRDAYDAVSLPMAETRPMCARSWWRRCTSSSPNGRGGYHRRAGDE
jgi:hypothetical protein